MNSEGISMSHEEAFANTKVPHTTAEGIWNKATMLIGEENAIVVVPGCEPKDTMVKSKSGTVPHLVTATDDFEYKNVMTNAYSISLFPYVHNFTSCCCCSIQGWSEGVHGLIKYMETINLVLLNWQFMICQLRQAIKVGSYLERELSICMFRIPLKWSQTVSIGGASVKSLY